MVRGTLLSILILLIALISCQPPSAPQLSLNASIPDKIDFNFHVRPILSDRCFACHGPDEKARKGNLRLDIESSAFVSMDSLEERYAIVPNNLDKSILVHRIISKDLEEMMPPPESNLQLSEREIEILKRWIKQGAVWKSHWAFTPPIKQAIPKIANAKWAKNPIDNYIYTRLAQKDLQPSAEASKEKLIRRLSFDLRGIPPNLEEIDAFLADKSSDAYEKMVDIFLAQKSYGERMAMEWMDLARYADSHGYQDDIERSMWPWRDWVIDAFNKNMSYKQFVSWQLAGDLLPSATYEQKLATGFNRNHKITQEVGVIDEEYRVTYVLDRTNTFSTAFLGLTVECAQCHDHKYDPISQKEYYSLFSFFNNVPEKGRVDYNVEVAEPSLPLPEEKVEKLRAYINNLFKKQQTQLRDYAAEKWAKGFDANHLKNKSNSFPIPSGLFAHFPLDYIENNQINEVLFNTQSAIINDLIPVRGKFSGGLEFMGNNYANLEFKNPLNFNRPFSISFWAKSLDGGIRGTILASEIDGKKDKEFYLQVTNEKFLKLILDNKRTSTRLQVLSRETIPDNRWVHIGLTFDGTGRNKGVAMYFDGQLLEKHIEQDDIRRSSLKVVKKLYLGNNPDKKGFMSGQLDELLFFNRQLSSKEIKNLASYNPITSLIAKKNKSKKDLKRLFYNEILLQDSEYQLLAERLKEYKIREGRTEDIILKPTMVMAERDTLRPTFVLNRGQYDAPTEQVNSGTPTAVLAFKEEQAKNRLGLAQWLFAPTHPLTARVAVNRYWQMVFGRGIVATSGDFGSQGSLPSHPQLLDWLAIEFRESGWDVKKLFKTMVLSATYRQTVNTNPKLQQLDPDNILLARGPQMRLSGELVRDHALAISGLLSPEVGGPSVKPYQPKGLWLEVASGNQSLRKYIQEHDQDLYRKSLYTFWKRTVPPPSMTIFDAPSREQCTIKRRATSTPMQALVMLNDPQFTEASRLIAVRMLQNGGDSAEERIQFAFRLATSRQATTKEINLLSSLLKQEKIAFDSNPNAANQLIAIGEYPLPTDFNATELAAYTVVANAILNLTETINKG